MAIEVETPLTRRALIAGGFGGLAAFVMQALGRATPVHAEGQAIAVGGEYYDATSMTYIANNSNDAYVLAAQSTHAGSAVLGVSSQGNGVEGISSGPLGSGVYGGNNGYGGAGVSGFGGDDGYGGQFWGNRAHLYLIPNTKPGKPTSGEHKKGEIMLNGASLFLCTAAGTPGTWKKVVTKLV
jgi:hypothetical protein